MIDPETLKAMRQLNDRMHQRAHSHRPPNEPFARRAPQVRPAPPVPPHIQQPQENKP